MFNKEVYLNRRAVLASIVKSGLLLFLGNEESPINFKDNTYHFRQDSSFLYFFGIDAANLAAVIDLDNDQVTIFGDEMSIDDIVWMGRQQTLAEKCTASGISHCKPSAALAPYLALAKQQQRSIQYLPPYRAENTIKLAQWLNIPINLVKAHASTALVKAVVAQRSVKAAEEIAELDQAAALSADIHLMVMQRAKAGMYERELAAYIQEAALRNGTNLAYPAILTTRGEILHNHYHGNQLKAGQMVLNDSGVETAMGYAGDLTRTFPVDKKFSPVQKEMYNIVLNAYHAAVAMLKPGTMYLDVHYTACKTLAQGLKDMGLMKGNVDDAVALGAHALFFQCGTGHMMGLDVHDMEDLGEQHVGYTDELKKETQLFGLKSLRLGKTLAKGYVLTVEPGVYFIPELIQQWQAKQQFADYINYDQVAAFKDFGGIRVEDDFLITESGSRMLGKYLAITSNEIEDLRA